MTRDDFWTIVESVCWGELTLAPTLIDASCAKEDRSYEVGKLRLLEALPTVEDMRSFDAHYSTVTGELYKFFTKWVDESRDNRCADLGDDSFGDLLAHVIGLGRVEYARMFDEPWVLQRRGHDYDFAESFAYCLPCKSDYDPTCVKLAREVHGLEYWQSQLAENERIEEQSLQSTCARHELEWRGKACDKLRERLVAEGGTEITQEEYEAHLLAEEAKQRAAWETVNERRTAKAAAKAKLLVDFEEEWA